MNLVKSIQIVLLSWVTILIPFYKAIIILGISCNVLYAQNIKVDSLRTALSNTTADLGRLTLMNELSRVMIDTDSEQALLYGRKALALSRQINEREKEASAMYNIGMLLFETPKIDSSLIYFEASEQLANKLNWRQLQADNLMRIANWYRYHRTDSAKTIHYLLKSVEVSKAAGYDYGTGRSYAKLASVYTRYKRIHLCEAYLKLSAKYYLRTADGEEHIAHYYNEVGDKIWAYNPRKSMDFYFEGLKFLESHPHIKVSLGKAYSIIGEPNIALKYLKEAVAHLDSIQSERRLGIALAQLAEVQVQLGNHKAAFKSCEQAISVLTPLSLSTQSSLPSIYRTIGRLMELEGRDQSALEFYIKSLDKANEINKMFEPVKIIFKTVKANIVLGNFYSDRTPEKGEKYCKEALENAKKSSYTNLEIDACECLYKISKKGKRYLDALKYFERKEALDDSLSTLTVEHAFEVAQKDKQLAEEAHQKERKDEQIKNQKRLNAILGISLLIGFLLIGFLTRSRRRISKQNAEITRKTGELKNANLSLARSNEDLERFAYVASHDLKSPLNTIVNFNGLISKTLKKEENPKVFQYLHFIETSGTRMIQLIEDILEYSKLSNKQSSERELDIINLNALIKEISQLIINNPEGKSVNIEANDLPNLRWNHSKIFLLFKNLIENGLKYNESAHPTIRLHFTNSGDTNLISIEDNGIGIKKENFEKIFVMFQRLHSQSKYEGTGLGLATCKKIVDEFKGEISISSEVGKGTTFQIQLPGNLINK